MGLRDVLGRERSSLVLLHPTALPDPPGRSYGVGELGSQATRFLDWLAEGGFVLWQVLPLGHTGYGNSPYQTFSRYAGSPYLVSVERLLEAGDLTPADHDAYVRRVEEAGLAEGRADYGWLYRHKVGADWGEASGREEPPAILRRAYRNLAVGHGPRQEAFRTFIRRAGGWLRDYADFMAIKELHGHVPWDRWQPQYRDVAAWRARRDEALARSAALAETVAFYEYTQFVFAEQWQAVREHAARLGRRIVGDIPWYVGYDSADVWAHPAFFDLDAEGTPVHVAGVPPDYFSATGQLWGNPVYRWWDASGALNEAAVAWWAGAIAHLLTTVDLLRVDHFRAIDSFWKIPYGSPTAQRGVWGKGPGQRLLEALRERLGAEHLPLIAEDLGYFDPLAPDRPDYPAEFPPERRFAVDEHLRALMTTGDPADLPAFDPETRIYRPRVAVDRLMEAFGLPWMGILQFAFEGENRFLPQNLVENSVIYTGTHDNNTTLGWYLDMARAETQGAHDPLGQPVQGATRYHAHMAGFRRLDERPQMNVSWDLVELALASPSAVAGVPIADILRRGEEARVNLPGDISRPWWDWRARREDLEDAALASALRRMNTHYGRAG